MLVSIIIPVYNGEEYLEQTILSAINQTYRNIEIIIIDDGSTDNSANIAKKYINCYCKFFSQQNKGVSAARNTGLKHAKGTYIQFLDADDLIAVTKIEEQINAANKEFPAFICSNWVRISNKSSFDKMTFTTSSFTPSLTNLPINLISGNNFIPLMSGLIHRETLIDINGFDTTMTHIEDVNLLIRLYLKNTNFIYHKSPTPLFYYRGVMTSASNQNFEAFFYGVYRNCKLLTKEFNLQNEKILLENYWNIYLNSIKKNYNELTKLSAVELKSYHSNLKNDYKFKIFKLTGHRVFSILYRFYNVFI